jgi:hypothetical protein
VNGKECTRRAQDCRVVSCRVVSCHTCNTGGLRGGGAFGRDGVLVAQLLLREKVSERAQAGAGSVRRVLTIAHGRVEGNRLDSVELSD